MTWVLWVYLITAVNHQPVYVQLVVSAPVVFKSKEACAERGRFWLSPATKVICDVPGQPELQFEVKGS